MTHKLKPTIGEQIKAHFNKNQSWLAEQIGMSNGNLSKKLNDKIKWSQSDIDKINKALGTSYKL